MIVNTKGDDGGQFGGHYDGQLEWDHYVEY